MKIYGHPLSSCTRKVKMTLAEKGAAAEFAVIDLFTGEHKSAGHLARQPFGVVPASRTTASSSTSRGRSSGTSISASADRRWCRLRRATSLG
jgi:hypothetical protein